MSTKAKYRNGILQFYESDTQETDDVFSPVFWGDDFLLKLDTTNTWTSRITGAAPPTTAIVASAGSGAVACALTSTSEAQLAKLDWNNNETLDCTKGLVFEARIKLSVLPTGSVIAAVGLAGDHNATFASMSPRICFRADGSGVLTIDSVDGTHSNVQVATGTTLDNATWAILKIDLTTLTNVLFYINGAQVASGTTFDFSSATGPLQPILQVSKGAATTVGTIQADYLRAWQKRS